MNTNKLPNGSFKCPECKREHLSGCLASGASNCIAEKYLCDCGAVKATK